MMHGADGKMMFRRDTTRFYKDAIPCEIFLLCLLVCVAWLLIRFFRFLYNRWSEKKTVA